MLHLREAQGRGEHHMMALFSLEFHVPLTLGAPEAKKASELGTWA